MLKDKVIAQVIPPSRNNRFFGQYIIKHGFQFKYTFMVFGLLVVSLGLVWLEGHVIISRMLENNMIANDDVKLQLELVSEITGKTSTLLAAIGFALTLFLSHFIAGPLYRFEKTFEEMRDGNLAVQMRLRGHDEFKDSADVLNQALSSLRNKLKKERETSWAVLERAKLVVAKLSESGRTAELDELKKLIADMESQTPIIKI